MSHRLRDRATRHGRRRVWQPNGLLVAVAIIFFSPVFALAQGGKSVPSHNEVVVPEVTPPSTESLIETPGHKIEYNPDGTIALSTNEADGVRLWPDGTLGSDNGYCEKKEIVRARECRKIGDGAFLYVDVEYQTYLCGGKKGRAIKSFKIVKDVDGNAASCPAYQYNEEARKAKEWGETWETVACVGKDGVKSPQGLVHATLIALNDEQGLSIWQDMEGNLFVAWFDAAGNGFWENDNGKVQGRPPHKPTKDDVGKWLPPGGAEKIEETADGTKHYHYPNGTDLYQKANGDVEMVNPDGSKSIWEKPDPSVETYKKKSVPGEIQKALEKDPSAAQDLLKGPPSQAPVLKDAGSKDSKSGTGFNAPVKPAGSFVAKSEIEKEILAVRAAVRDTCPVPTETSEGGGGRGEISTTRLPSDGGVTVATDAREWCTFGDAVATYVRLKPADENGEPIVYSTPATPGLAIDRSIGDRPRSATPATPAQKTVSLEPKEPIAPVKQPTPEQPKKTDSPPTADKPPEKPPEKPPTEATPTDDVVILFKGNQAVLEQGQTGEALNGEHVMLVFKKPDAPGTRNAKKDDSGFDKDGVQGVTGPDGRAKLTVRAEDHPLYLSSLGGRPNKYYRIDANAMKNTGSVGEVARGSTLDLAEGAPKGGKLAAETFKIGDRTFVRRLYIAPYNATVVLLSGDKVDWCRVIEPAPGLGAEPDNPSVLHRELPEAVLRLPMRRHAR